MPMLTDPEFIKRLESLFLLSRKVVGGTLKADRKSDKKGSGILFADHAEYSLGDDYRSIDWKIFGRLEQLVIRLYELEEDVSIYVLVDMSPSMEGKSLYARKLAAALGYIALNNADRLAVYAMSDRLETVLGPSHGRGKVLPMLRSLQDQECYGSDTRFQECAADFRTRCKRKGVCVVISDFFTPHGYTKGLDLLKWSKHDVFCLQVLDPADLTCDWKGDLELECVESGRRKKVTIGPREANRYVQAMQEWNKTLERECNRREIGFARAMTNIPFEEIVQFILRRGGLVA